MTTYTFTKNAEKYFKKVEEPEAPPVQEETKRFNLRLSNGDMDFIKFLSEKEGVSRNQIIDEIINSIIYDFLSSLDTEECSLLIRKADEINKVNTSKNMDFSWVSNLYPSCPPYDHIINDLFNQPKLSDLSNRSDRYKKMFTSIVNSKLGKNFDEQQTGKDANEKEE